MATKLVLDVEEEEESFLFQHQVQQNITQARSQLEHVCQLDIEQPVGFVRQTSIICTIGDACDTKDMLRQLIDNGMNIARLNLTLGSYKYHSEIIEHIRTIEKEMPEPGCVAIAVDITAPTVRTGLINGNYQEEVRFEEGKFVTLTTNDEFKLCCTTETLWIDNSFFRKVMNAMAIGDRVFIDDGAIIVIVREKHMDGSVRCLVEQGGMLGSSKRVQIPRNSLYKYAVMEKYRQGLLYALDNEVDMIFASFIESGEDVMRIRKVLGDIGRNIKIIVKIETRSAAQQGFDGILAAADGILISRGDLGLEVPLQKVFILQKSIIARCLRAKKPVIVATQMLESMRINPRPTRAEASDVANAVIDGADCLMLGVETARGQHPIEALKNMHLICREAESGMFHGRIFLELKQMLPRDQRCNEVHGSAIAAVEASMRTQASAIILVTSTGISASIVSTYRPRCPILAVVRRAEVGRQCLLYRGIHPILFKGPKLDDWSDDMDSRINFVIEYGRHRGFLSPGDKVVVMTGWHAGSGGTNTVRLVEIQKEKEVLRVVRSTVGERWEHLD